MTWQAADEIVIPIQHADSLRVADTKLRGLLFLARTNGLAHGVVDGLAVSVRVEAGCFVIRQEAV